MRSKILKIVAGSMLAILLVTSLAPAQPAQAYDIPSAISTCIKGVAVNLLISAAGTVALSALLAVPTLDLPSASNLIKEYFEDPFARCLARQILDSTVTGMLDSVRTKGRDGGKSYVSNWRNFQLGSLVRGENIFKSIAANTAFCNYLQKDLQGTFRITDKFKIPLTGQSLRAGDLDPYTLRARCTLPNDFNIGNYQQNFAANGGWSAFIRMLEPANNPFGAQQLAQDELDKQRAVEATADAAETATSDGYLGLRGDAPCLQKAPNGSCILYSDIKSPGSYVSAAVGATIQQELAWVTNIDELNEVVVAGIIERLNNRLLSFESPEGAPAYNNDTQGILPPICIEPGSTLTPTGDGELFKPGDEPKTDRQIQLRSQLVGLGTSIVDLAKTRNVSTGIIPGAPNIGINLDGSKGNIRNNLGDITKVNGGRAGEIGPNRILILYNKSVAPSGSTDFDDPLDKNKADIIKNMPIANQGAAVGVIAQFDRTAVQLFTGVDIDTSGIPECAPLPTGIPGDPGDIGGTCEPYQQMNQQAGLCVNGVDRDCKAYCPGQGGSYVDDDGSTVTIESCGGFSDGSAAYDLAAGHKALYIPPANEGGGRKLYHVTFGNWKQWEWWKAPAPTDNKAWCKPGYELEPAQAPSTEPPVSYARCIDGSTGGLAIITPDPATCIEDPIPSNPPTGSPTPGGSGTCQRELPPGQLGPYGGDIRGIIESIANGSSGLLDKNDVSAGAYRILNGDGYMNEVASQLRGRGYVFVRRDSGGDGDKEIMLKRSNSDKHQQYSLARTGPNGELFGYTRTAHKGLNCTP